MRSWVFASAGAAPIALIGGWIWAQTRQPNGFDATTDTISALAAEGATDRWIMTTGLVVLGVCHIATAAGLPEAARWGRILLAIGGLATLSVAAAAQPNPLHSPAAAVAFVALALWPAFSRLPRPAVAIGATVVLLVLLGWLAIEIRGGDALGLSERVLAAAQALWPLIVVSLVAIAQRRARRAALVRAGDAGPRAPTTG